MSNNSSFFLFLPGAHIYYHCRSYRSRSELFMDLVSKRDYPLYYTMIKTPISMNMIKKRLNSTYYRTIAHFRDDFHLMFNNARTFNEEGSFVYEDANEMQVSFTEYIFHMHTKKLI